MKNALKIAALTVLATAFYTYVSHMVPQQVTYPPESVEIRSDMTAEQMVEVGKEIVGGKGGCLGCHTIGSEKAERFPDLGGIGAKAGKRKEGMTDVEYLAESLYDPDAYIVAGFNPGMIPANKPPISLTDQEILAVIAYLQSLGSTPTVTLQTKLKYAGISPASTTLQRSATTADASAKTGGLSGEELLANYGCVACHKLDTPESTVGPSLYDVGKKLSAAAIYEAIMDPDATITEGFEPGLMTATLQGTQFYEKISASELKTIVDYLASRKGDK